METNHFYPEGKQINAPENAQWLTSQATLAEAAVSGIVLEARVTMCDAAHNLHVDLPCMPAVIPHEEGALGIADGTTRDIALISRVGKPVCFTVTGFDRAADGTPRAILSRRDAQRRCRAYLWQQLHTGDIIPAKVTRLESFGAFCDIGCGVSALMPIAGMSVSRIAHPCDRLQVGADVFAVVSSMENDRFCLSQRELLGTWEENVSLFSQGETVIGIVRSVESYGIFIELTPNLAGLAEPRADIAPGQAVSVYIKSILPDKMKVKLIIIDHAHAVTPPPITYYMRAGHIEHWQYSPPGAAKQIESFFEKIEGNTCQNASNFVY